MDGVIQVVECIRSIQGANVDCSIRQGRDKVLDQFLLSFGIASEQDIVNLEDALVELPSWVAPLNLPDDYLFFQEFYGGLGIHTPAYYFDVRGIGPMTDDWYGDVVRDDDAIYENGLLLIGTLAYGSNPRRFVRFFLDLAGVIDQGCIYAVGPQEPPYPSILPVLQNPHDHPTRLTKVANTFTEWLEIVAETKGVFGYV